MKLLLALAFLCLSFSSFCKDEDLINDQIDSLTKMSPEDYYAKADQIRESIDRFLVMKKKVCQGDYASGILSSAPMPQEHPSHLDEKEKKKCFRELRNMHLSYIENTYKARKRYLEKMNKDRLSELEKYRDDSTREIKETFKD